MEIQVFAFGIYLLAGSYLLWKAVRSAATIWKTGLLWRWKRSPVGRLANVDQPEKQISTHSYFIELVGLASGIALELFFLRRFHPAFWLLLVWVAIGLGLEILRPTPTQRALPDVITLVSIYRAATARGYDLPGALRFALVKLPAGGVKEALEEAFLRQRRGLRVDQCLKPLKRCHPYLAEFVALHESGGALHQGRYGSLAILHRARWELALNYRAYHVVDKTQNYIRPLRGFIAGGLIAALWFQAPQLQLAIASIWMRLFV